MCWPTWRAGQISRPARLTANGAVVAEPELPVTRVVTLPPPASILPRLNAQIDAAVNALPVNAKGEIVFDVRTVKDGKVSSNLAFVKKFEHNWDVMLWVGKTWGDPGHPDAGVTVRKSFLK
jgi:hypothetical protein